MIDEGALTGLLAGHLPRQRWFAGPSGAGEAVGDVRAVSMRVLREGWPALVHGVVEAAGARWQLAIGLRPLDDLGTAVEGKPDAVIGELDTDRGRALAYDATVDPELSLALLQLVAGDQEATRARYLVADQSNTSVVFDERLILKLYRRLGDGPNPDVEVARALEGVGFPNVAKQLAAWQDGDVSLAVVNEFLVGGVDGFHLALTSIHDLLEAGLAPAEAGGDFGPEAHRLGAVTAGLHLALAEAFGTGPGEPGRWADEMDEQLARTPSVELDLAAVAAYYEALRSADAGASIRVHGDYHLGQVLRTDTGWYVLDFEGEPARPLAERTRPSSALRDVAGMLRSLHYAVEVALRDYGYGGDPRAVALGTAWEDRNAAAFLEGYHATEGVDRLLPAGGHDRDVVLGAFLLDKAVYEVAYEAAHRPGWLDIPVGAIRRMLASPGPPPT